MLNTYFDYKHIRKTEHPDWKTHWYNLLDSRFVVQDNELVEDSNAPIHRLGFTVAEVAEAIQHTGLTKRQLDWYQCQPDRYEPAGDDYIQVPGWAATWAKTQLSKGAEAKLTEIDAAVSSELRRPFKYLDNTWYLDFEYILGIFTLLPLLPTDWHIEWKTADKPDGINNSYVVMDKAGITGLALAALERKSSVWAAGDAQKKQLKALSSIEDVKAFVIGSPPHINLSNDVDNISVVDGNKSR